LKLTIKDIAKICDVSVTTVSRTINGREEGVGAKTRKKILAAIKESGYQPNTIARSMITKKTNTIALVIPDICNPFFAELARGVGDICAEQGYHLFLCNTDGSMEQERGQVVFLQEHLVDGIILTTQNSVEDDGIISDLIKDKFPFVLVERYVEGMDIELQVTIDNAGGIEKVVDYLAKNGHRKIAFVGGPLDANNAKQRFTGYKRGLAKNGLTYDNSLVLSGDYQLKSGYDATTKLLETKRGEFTAIVLANDLMAIGACNAITNMKLKVPEDISVAGFDNLSMTNVIQPRITTAGVPIDKLGRTAAKLLCQRLAGVEKKNHVKIECEVFVRESIRKIN